MWLLKGLVCGRLSGDAPLTCPPIARAGLKFWVNDTGWIANFLVMSLAFVLY